MNKVVFVLGFIFVSFLYFGCGSVPLKTTLSDLEEQVEELKADGWKVYPGEKSLRSQLEESIEASDALDADGTNKYYFGVGNTVGKTQQAALQAATELAWLNLVSLLGSTITKAVQTDLSNNQLDENTAASITKVLNVASSMTQKNVGPAKTFFKASRKKENNTIEVQVRLGYNVADAKKLIIQEMQNALTKELVTETNEFKNSVKDYILGPMQKKDLAPNSAK